MKISLNVSTECCATCSNWTGDRKIQFGRSKLSIIQKEVIILKYVNEMSLSEVSEVLQMSKDTVKSHHRRALIKMKKLLEAVSHAPKLQK